MFTLGDILVKRARIGRENEALVFHDVRMSYGELHVRTNRLANAMLARGLQPGDRIAVLAENSHRFVEVCFACAKAGLVFTPLNYRLTLRELSFMLADSGARALFVDKQHAAIGQSLTSASTAKTLLFGLDDSCGTDFDYEITLAQTIDDIPDVLVNENDLAMLLYTGGTTGLPKGVMLSHRNLLTAFTNIVVQFKFTDHDTTLMVLPMFHVAIWQVICHLMVGARVVIRSRAEVPDILATIERERCTSMNAVPTLYNWIISDPLLNKHDLSSIRLLVYGGSPFPEEVLRRCIAHFGPIFAQGYGLTEAAPTVCFLAPEDHVLDGPRANLLKSAGREMFLTEVRIADAHGNTVPLGEPGEVLARGANVMIGYWNNEELSKERLHQGWLRTGDVGYMDANGYVFLLDRKADMIVSGGENIYPTEVEAVLYQHVAVQECIVTSAPDARWGERVQAAVVLKPDVKATEEELLQFCRERLASYKHPKRIEFWETLPRSPVGKLLRKEVRVVFWDGVERQIR